MLMSIRVGLFAGIIWGGIRWLAVAMNFTKVPQAFLLDPFLKRALLYNGWLQLAGWLLFITLSVIAGAIYWLLLRKLDGPWPGLLYGIVWWLLGYALAGPFIGAIPPLREVGWNSLTTDLCLFTLWGLFIGYSIAFEVHDEANREPKADAKVT